jgi:cell division protein FtsB
MIFVKLLPQQPCYLSLVLFAMRSSNAFDRVPRFLRSFYFYTGLGFLVWMFVFDANDFVKQYDMYQKWRELQKEKKYYLDNIEVVKKERAELLSSPELLEKFAREKYIMKRPGEDVFVLVPQAKEE